MDKYEFNLKVEQIKKLASRKRYKEASAIASELEWRKVKDWSILSMVINVHEAVENYEEARDMAILAYNRNLGGKKLVYKLVEILIQLKDFDTAEELFEEYEKMASRDVNKYILRYDLRRAQKATDNELIEILEDFKEHEVDEHYMYELARLYLKTGRQDECFKICDDIVLWFQDGIYVEKALLLKEENGAKLTSSQKKILERVKEHKENLDITKEILFEEQKKNAVFADEIREAVLEEDDDFSEKIRNTKSKKKTGGFKSFIKKTFSFDEVSDEDDFGEEYNISAVEESEEEKKKPRESVSFVFEPKKEDESNPPEVNKVVLGNTKQFEAVGSNSKKNIFESDEKNDTRDSISKASTSLKELIEDAKRKIENGYVLDDAYEREADDTAEREALNQVVKEVSEVGEESSEDRENGKSGKSEEAKAVEKDEDIFDDAHGLFNYEDSLYDTQNIQEEIAKNLADLMESDEGSDMPESVQNQFNAEESDDYIEGQINLSEWMESVREEKYGSQHTREFSRAELEEMLDKKDEQSAAYEKIISEKKRQSQKRNPQSEEERQADAIMMLNAAKTDLLLRTGKATVHLEVEADSIRRAGRRFIEDAYRKREEQLKSQQEEKRQQEIANTVQEKKASKKKDEVNQAEQITDTSSFKIMAEFKAMTGQIEVPEVKNTEASFEEVSLDTTATGRMSKKVRETLGLSEDENGGKQKYISANVAANISINGDEKRLTGELAKLFKKYRELPGLEEQLVDYFCALDAEMNMTSSKRGNIIISGNSSSDKSDLARTLVRAINYLYPDRPKKIAKTTGDSINLRGISKAMPKLMGTALIVEGAGSIQPKRMTEILSCLEQDTDRMIVILEDADAEMNVLLNFNPGMEKSFNHRIVLKHYTVNELVEMARLFARRRQYEVEDDALLELYLKIDRIKGNSDNINLDEIKEIINQAIEKSELRASKKFFGGLKKKRSEGGDVTYLTEADFK